MVDLALGLKQDMNRSYAKISHLLMQSEKANPRKSKIHKLNSEKVQEFAEKVKN